MSADSIRAATRWTTRTIPIILAGAVAYTTYVIVAHICVDYLINRRGDDGSAIVILVLYFLLMLLMIATYLRTICIINIDPCIVPLGPLAVERRKNEAKRRRSWRRKSDLEGQPYYVGPDQNPDSPGLELFYTRDAFVCENDGRPKWCSECCNWKPDRAHHSSEINRCVLRMDHYCPWVGGMVGENSFKFFTQFTMYTASYCGLVLGAGGSTLRKRLNEEQYLDVRIIVVLALGGFFGLFTAMMTLTSWRYILVNLTNVDILGAKRKVYQLAIRVPRETASTELYHVINYPLSQPDRGSDGHANGHPTIAYQQGTTASGPNRVHADRDALATRTFAIVKTDPGENPWDLGFRQNWIDVMGTSILDWFLPIRTSPCTNHDSMESFYRMGPALKRFRSRYGLNESSSDETHTVEMRDFGRSRT